VACRPESRLMPREPPTNFREKAKLFRDRAEKALSALERDLLLALAADNDRLADELEALRKQWAARESVKAKR
jgi:hypothetical protein